MPTSRFEELHVWRESFALALSISNICRGFPSHERYDLVPQLRRAARSVHNNLAEGVGSQTAATFLRYVYIALGSMSEVENHLLIARAEGYITDATCMELRERAGKVRGLLLLLAASLRKASRRQ